jgi:steroid 5-alpha reductase family enzyme
VKKDLIKIALLYIATGCVGFFVLAMNSKLDAVYRFFIADLAMTLMIFIISTWYRNSSVYDAYWSVIPFYFVIWWLLAYGLFLSGPQIIALGLISLWSWRLTLNWARSWHGMGHEDWRYVELAATSGRFYPLVNFLGIHLFPTLMVFACIWPIFYIFISPLSSPPMMYAGLAIGLLGVVMEHLADNTLFAFRRNSAHSGKVLDKGLWGICRHPNYAGEMLFWLGIAFIGRGYGAPWYTLGGVVALWAMFILVTIPMKEKRMAQRYPAYAEYRQRTPLLLPRLFGSISKSERTI